MHTQEDPTVIAPNSHSTAPAPSMPTPEEPKKKHDTVRSIFSTIAILIAAPLVAIFLTAFVFQSYQVDGDSMETTLQNNDRLIVYKVPRTIARVTGNDYIPNRADVVIFVKHNLEEGNGIPGDKQLIKRVVGLPGERVVIKDGLLTVYNEQNPNGFNPDKTNPYGRVITNTPRDTDVIVQPGHVFVMGDNRSNSLDSRYFGPIASSDIIGKLVMRVFPLNNAKLF